MLENTTNAKEELRRARKEEVHKNYEYFEKNIAAIKSKSNGKNFVLLHKLEVKGYFKVFSDAVEKGKALYKDTPFSIQEIEEKPGNLGFQTYAVFK